MKNLLKIWSLLDLRLSGIMTGGWRKGAASLCGWERKTHGMLSQQLHLPSSQYTSLSLDY